MSQWAEFSVLVVEDSRIQREYVCCQLEMLGFTHILQAGDGIQALKVLDERGEGGVDLVISDLDMPGMDGIELMRRLTQRHLARHLIVMTARDPKLLDAVESMAGEDTALPLLGTLRKPIDLQSLAQILHGIQAQKKSSAHVKEQASIGLDEIANALERGEFIPYFQPKIILNTGMIKGVESLARWQHPELGLLAPARFIPQIENSDLIEPFTWVILDAVLQQLAAWQRHGLMISAAVNLSAQSLTDNAIADQIAERVQAYKLPAHALVLEVTETMVMRNLSQAIGNLARLRLKGFGLAMDDYGIGYSSAQQLSRCPFTELKIDRAFVHGAADHDNRRVILESSIEMGKRLGITTVAEGVETAEDWHLLQMLGCNVGQGYYAAKPMPGEDLPQWIRDNRERLRPKR